MRNRSPQRPADSPLSSRLLIWQRLTSIARSRSRRRRAGDFFQIVNQMDDEHPPGSPRPGWPRRQGHGRVSLGHQRPGMLILLIEYEEADVLQLLLDTVGREVDELNLVSIASSRTASSTRRRRASSRRRSRGCVRRRWPTSGRPSRRASRRSRRRRAPRSCARCLTGSPSVSDSMSTCAPLTCRRPPTSSLPFSTCH